MTVRSEEMYEEYRPVFSAAADYLSAFEKNGYDKAAVGSISAALDEMHSTPLSDILRGQNDAVRFTVTLGVLVNFSRPAAEKLYSVFGIRAGSITPEAVCELFFGVSDIFPLTGELSPYLVLDRFFDGVSPNYNAVMALKPFAARFIADGEIDDDTFMPEPHYGTDHITLSENSRAEREISAAVRGGIADALRIVYVCGEEGVGRRTAAQRALDSAGRGSVMLRGDLRYDRKRIRELASKLILLDAVPIVIQNESGDTEDYIRFVRALSEETGTVIAVCGYDLKGAGAET